MSKAATISGLRYFHHAALLGEFDGYPMDPWFSQFLGDVRFTGYLPDFASATVKIEDQEMRNTHSRCETHFRNNF